MKKFLITFIFIILSKNIFAGSEKFKGSWLCIEEEGVGFNWNEYNSKWEAVSKFSREKYIFKVLDTTDCYKWETGKVCVKLYKFGENEFDYSSTFNYWEKGEYTGSDQLTGSTVIGKFRLSEEGSFIYSFNIPGSVGKGLPFGNSENYKDSMKVSVGKCSKI